MLKRYFLFLFLLPAMAVNAQNGLFQSYDYVIQTANSVTTAQPQQGSNLDAYSGADAYAVIQNAINDLSKVNGGSIYISAGVYYLSDELVITGWDQNLPPNKQLKITGAGYGTQLIQNTSDKNGLVIKNRASIVLTDLYIFSGSNARSALLLDDSGANFDVSVWGGTIDNLFLQSGSTNYPALYAKNFFNLNIPRLTAINVNNYGIVLENTSQNTNYGNSNFGLLIAGASTTPPFAGLYITNSNSNGSHFLNQMTFVHYECAAGYRGISSNGTNFNTFAFVDIEGVAQPIYFEGSSSTGECRLNKFVSGYLFPSSGGQAITNTVATGGNDFSLFIEGDRSTTPITDRSEYRPVNNYNLVYGPGVDEQKSVITSPSTLFTIRKNDGTVLKNPPLTGN